jgi:cation:H+ antiporter
VVHLLLALCGFAVASFATLVAARVFAAWLDRLGARLGFSEALLGVLTAVAADGPELSSAVTALARGEHDVGLGVVLGSNAFNLAAMLGGGAILCGALAPRRPALALEAVAAGWTTAVATLLLLGYLSPLSALLSCAVVLVPYVTVLVLGDLRLHLLPVPAAVHRGLREALGGGFAHHRPAAHHGPLWLPVAAIAAAVTAIVAGSIAMVDTALVVADRTHLSHAAAGLLILAVVTSLPNVATALRLARQGRADAAVSETFNSNTINLLGGAIVPAAIVGLGSVSAADLRAVACLAAMTVGTLAALARPRGLGRRGGVLLIAAYAAFLAVGLRR